MAASSYEILLAIGGKLSSSLATSISGASKSLEGMGKSAETAGQSLNGMSQGSRMDGLKNSLTEIKLAFGAVGLMAASYLKGAIDSAIASQKGYCKPRNYD